MAKTMIQKTNLYQEAERRLKEFRRLEIETERALQRAPVGKLHIKRRNNRCQYYIREDAKERNGRYVRKKDWGKMDRYVQKMYDEKILIAIRDERCRLERLLDQRRDTDTIIADAYSKEVDFLKEMIQPLAMSDQDYIDQWMKIPYERKSTEALKSNFITDRGEQVRSKSELLIANALNKKGIPYKYECPLILKNGNIIYPDFTILDVKQRRIIYWEHRGMMDDREYARHSVQRIRDYRNSGIYLDRDLIITEETSMNPLGTQEIIQLIEHYFDS